MARCWNRFGTALLFLLALGCTHTVRPTNMVPDAATAIKIGAAIIEAHIGSKAYREFEKDQKLVCYPEGADWSVFFYPTDPDIGKMTRLPDGRTIVKALSGGGSPTIIISRQDGRILNFYYAR